MREFDLNKTDKLSPKFQDLYAKAKDFVENECIPAERIFALQMGKGEDRWKVGAEGQRLFYLGGCYGNCEPSSQKTHENH